MNIYFKHSIAVLGMILAILSIYFGSLLPFVKSRLYINALNSMSSVKSLADFKEKFDKPLTFYSPIGDEEIVKFLSSNIIGAVSDQNNPEEVSRFLVDYIEPYAFKDNVRHLIVMGQMYSILWQRFNKEEDFNKAEEYYLRAIKIGPKLPPVLYSLLDIERAKGNKEKVREIGEKILQYWPDDEKTKAIVSQ